MRRWVIVAVVLVLAAAGVTMALTRDAGGDNAAAADWQADLTGWEGEQAQALVPPDGPALSAVVTGEAMSPLGGDGTEESVDEVNAACTRLTAFADQVRDTPGPPAVPAQVQVSEEQTAAFESDLAALTTFQQAVQEPAATLRQFCGTYPVLIGAHQSDGDADEARQTFAQALDAQCPLPDLADACSALSAGAQQGGEGSGGEPGSPPAIEPARIRQVIVAELTATEEAIDDAATAFAAELASA
ncbi:hypothetical protein [Ruania zhangjianzhongii]|uniref:hypothetical protein n=1 Tax=Ruania zhangjianzhongii TaxID=2603206 RepID=UPI0011C6F669|nr:hypothetical protein [Ruania zhangjianzhongii]